VDLPMRIDKKFNGFLTLIALLAVLSIGVLAQRIDQTVMPATTSPSSASSTTATRTMPEVKQPLPFGEGEVMKFEVKFSRFPIYASVGEMTFTVSEEKGKIEKSVKTATEAAIIDSAAAAQPDKKDELSIKEKGEQVDKVRIHADAVSKGALVSLFGVKVHDQFDSVLDKKDLGTYSCKVSVEEGKRRREQTTIVERDKHQIIYTERNLNEAKEEPKIVKSEFKDWPLIFDPVGAMFYVRTRELKLGQSIKIPISDNGKPSEIEIVPIASEDLKVEGEQFHTIKLDARVFDGALFNGKGEMFIWLNDDQYRMPVKFQIKAKYGTVTGNLIARKNADSKSAAVKDSVKPLEKKPE
jgi:hypothetical protein